MIIDYLKESLINEISDSAIKKAKDKFIATGIDTDEVNKILDSFKTLSDKGRIKGIDIFNVPFNDLENIVKKAEAKKSSKEVRTQLKSGADKIFENDKVLVVSPNTHEASCYYGAGTKWCIAAKTGTHFDSYYELGVKLYYLIPKDGSGKIAVAVYPPNINHRMEVFDDEDTKINTQNDNTFLDILDKLEIDRDIFKPMTREERISRKVKIIGLIKNSNGTYDSKEHIHSFQCMHLMDNGKFIIKFGTINGVFDCSKIGLKSLEGAPEEVKMSFNCSSNPLTTLEGGPKIVGGDYKCINCSLTSLKGAPEEINYLKDFNCKNNYLNTLEYAPKNVGGNFYCQENNLISLKGAPIEVGGSFQCQWNNLTSLDGAPKKCTGFYCYENDKEFTEEDVLKVTNADYIIVKKL